MWEFDELQSTFSLKSYPKEVSYSECEDRKTWLEGLALTDKKIDIEELMEPLNALRALLFNSLRPEEIAPFQKFRIFCAGKMSQVKEQLYEVCGLENYYFQNDIG